MFHTVAGDIFQTQNRLCLFNLFSLLSFCLQILFPFEYGHFAIFALFFTWEWSKNGELKNEYKRLWGVTPSATLNVLLLWSVLIFAEIILLPEKLMLHVLQHFYFVITPGVNIKSWESYALTNWSSISHRHSTIHHKRGMHFRRGTETNFSVDSSLNRPQCNPALWYVVVWVRDVTFLTLTFTVANTYRWNPSLPVNVARCLGKRRKSLRGKLRDEGCYTP